MTQGKTITLRPVTGADEAFLLSVYAGTRADELARVPWSAEQKEAFVRMQFTAQAQHYAAQEPAAHHDIICLDETPVGRIYLARRPNELHILDITLLPEYRKQGIGSHLLRRLQEEGASSGKPVSIYVENFNPSMGLFRQLGFHPVAEQGFHILLRWTPGVTPGISTSS